MKITRVCCQGCGADLQVDEAVRLVTCNYCHAKLEVVHDPTVTHTRLLEKLDRTTDRMAGNLRVIELQNDLERLDREWESGYGSGDAPAVTSNIIGAVAFGLLGLFMLGELLRGKGHPLLSWVFMGFSVWAVVNAVKGVTFARDYADAAAAYDAEREALIQRIEEARRK